MLIYVSIMWHNKRKQCYSIKSKSFKCKANSNEIIRINKTSPTSKIYSKSRMPLKWTLKVSYSPNNYCRNNRIWHGQYNNDYYV